MLVPVDAERLALAPVQSLRWVDRHDRPLAERVGALDARLAPVRLEDVSPHVVGALIAAEDRRFLAHPGVDLLATLRAAWQNLTHLQVVSGGSTLTQQLARLLETERALRAGTPPPARGLWQKLREAHLALRLERTLDKPQILEAFLNRAPFGNTAIGIEAAAQRYFAASAAALSAAQAAYLAGLPKGPTAYDPARSPERAMARQRRVLAAMRSRGALTEAQHERALAEPVRPRLHAPAPAAPHAVALARFSLEQQGRAQPTGTVALTIDVELQAFVQEVLASEAERLYRRGGRSAAALVLDTASGEVLAAVGAAFVDNPLWGQYSAVTAVRQPGSALKPFLYAAALEGGLTAASLAADIDRPFPDTWGVFMPENYDERMHGPVRLREALAQSLNVAAVDVLARTGLGRFYELLARAGLTTLERRPSYYGMGLVLGSAGVRLIELTNAYAMLARGGLAKPWKVLRDEPQGDAVRLVDERAAYVIADILSDANARASQFGERSVLSTPYWTAVKTGTSKGYRDNWTLGFTDRVTVGVWVGDPTGAPMREVSGVEGAGAIWRRIMNRVSGERSHRPTPPEGLVHVPICGVSGMRRGPHCEGGRDELFLAGTEPQRECTWHRDALVDPSNGLLVPEGCALAGTVRRLAIYPSPYDAWAVEEGAGVAERYTPRCAAPRPRAPVEVSLLSPAPREAVRIDPDAPLASQALPLHARVTGGPGPVTFLIDGAPFATTEPPHRVFWPVRPGTFRVQARFEPTGEVSAVHEVVVR